MKRPTPVLTSMTNLRNILHTIDTVINDLDQCMGGVYTHLWRRYVKKLKVAGSWLYPSTYMFRYGDDDTQFNIKHKEDTLF